MKKKILIGCIIAVFLMLSVSSLSTMQAVNIKTKEIEEEKDSVNVKSSSLPTFLIYFPIKYRRYYEQNPNLHVKYKYCIHVSVEDGIETEYYPNWSHEHGLNTNAIIFGLKSGDLIIQKLPINTN